MATTPDMAAAAAYGKKFAPGILGKVWTALKDAGIRVYPNIKGPTSFGKLSAGAGLKAYTGTFTPNAQIAFTDRELSPKLANYELEIEPMKYYNKWMADKLSANATSMDIPFAQFMWMEIVKEIESEIVNSIIGIGDTAYVGADAARKIADGFVKIINALGLTEEATGAITLTDVIDQLEAVYENVPSRFRKFEMNAYVSHGTADKYNKRYRTLYNASALYDAFGRTTLDIGNKKCSLFPVDWLTGDQIIITPQDNLVLGTDTLSDMQKIKMVERVHTYECAILFSIGLQVPDPEPIWVNDQL